MSNTAGNGSEATGETGRVGTTIGVEVGTTIGVEEEFHIVDAVTGEPVPAAARLLGGPRPADAEPELQRSMVETATAVCRTLAEVRAELVAKRRSLREAGAEHGIACVSAGTVPAAGSRPSTLYPGVRYEWMAREYRQLVTEQQVCACQVQVGVPDRDLAVRITRRIRDWLPALLAMSASSPMFAGGDTGYASYRTVITSRWPTVGPPPDLASAAEFDEMALALVSSGVIIDTNMLYFDARPSTKYPTVEIRVADACPNVDDAVLLAALARALVVTAADEDAAGLPVPCTPQVLLRAATWRAARSGLDGDLVDPVARRPVPAHERVAALLGHVRPVLERREEWAIVADLAADLLARGASAARQRALLGAGRSHRQLVAALLAETSTP